MAARSFLPIRAALALTLLTVALVSAAVPAVADTKPPSSGTPTTVSADALPTAQLNGVAWTQIVVGKTVFVGGSFSAARPAGVPSGGSGTVARSDMLAYDLTTGALIASFKPSFNGDVRALAASADGSTIYAGGSFTTVNGASRSRLVALNATTGAVVSSFTPSANATVYAMARSGSTLYLGGAFTTLAGAARSRAGAVTTAGALAAWAPKVADGAVRAVVVDPGGTKAVLGGSFSTVDGQARHGSALVDAAAGTTAGTWKVVNTVPDYGTDAAILSLSSDGTHVYGTGYDYGASNGSGFEGTFSASWTDGSITWIEDCHGDTYSNAPFGGAVYIAGHPHNCLTIGGFPQSNPETWHRGLAFSQAATGTVQANQQSGYQSFAGNPSPSLLTWFPDFNSGTYTGQDQGPWSVAASGDYVVYGGEFTTVGGAAQQGLVRFAVPSAAPNKVGPVLSGTALKPTLSASGSTVTVTWPSDWDRDNQQLTYRLYRGSTLVTTVTGLSTFWSLPALTYRDANRSGSVAYHVTVTDPWGNTATGATATITVG